MKKLLTLIALTAVLLTVNTVSHAQLVSSANPTKASLSSTDTAYAVLPVTNIVTSVEIGATKTSGTVGGKVYFEALNLNGDTWDKLDSLTVANSTGYQYKLIAMTAPFKYSAYRFRFLSTGGVWVPKALYLRRQ